MDPDDLVNKRIKRIAKDYAVTVKAVNEALDHHPIEIDRDRYLKRTLALELLRLDELEEAFREKAVLDRDVASGALLVKIYERRATLLGLNPPLGHAVQIVQHEPANAPTSTDRIRIAIHNVMGITARERELDDKQSIFDEPLTAEEQTELDKLRQAREVRRLQHNRDTAEDTPPQEITWTQR